MLQCTTLYVALGIPYLDSAYPYIVHQPPSSPVITQPYVTIIVSDIPNSPPCMAWIERINRLASDILFSIFRTANMTSDKSQCPLNGCISHGLSGFFTGENCGSQ